MFRASCLCGGVRLEISGDLGGISLCHCSLCRKVSGAAATATLVVPAKRIHWISGQELVRSYQRPSGYGNSFCQVCGSCLPDFDTAQEMIGIPAGILDDDPGAKVERHIYVGSKASWDQIAGNAPSYEDGYRPERRE